jgi:hypothetical protein
MVAISLSGQRRSIISNETQIKLREQAAKRKVCRQVFQVKQTECVKD